MLQQTLGKEGAALEKRVVVVKTKMTRASVRIGLGKVGIKLIFVLYGITSFPASSSAQRTAYASQPVTSEDHKGQVLSLAQGVNAGMAW